MTPRHPRPPGTCENTAPQKPCKVHDMGNSLSMGRVSAICQNTQIWVWPHSEESERPQFRQAEWTLDVTTVIKLLCSLEQMWGGWFTPRLSLWLLSSSPEVGRGTWEPWFCESDMDLGSCAGLLLLSKANAQEWSWLVWVGRELPFASEIL